MFKKIIFGLICFSMICLPIFAASTSITGDGNSTQIYSNLRDVSIGYVMVGSQEVGTMTWHPDFQWQDWGLGLDLNIPLGQNVPSGYQNLVLRQLKYDDGLKGLQYGVIERLTYGHGLLMKDYSTRLSSNSIMLNDQQMALKGYYDASVFALNGLATRTSVYALRVSEPVLPNLSIGQTYVTDVDGVIIPGTTTNQKVSGVALDATIPLAMDFEGYSEAAYLIDHGTGASAGISWAKNIMVADMSFLAEYRFINPGFIPGYFNANYETDPINLSSSEVNTTRNGFLAEVRASLLDLASGRLSYENYAGGNQSVNANLEARLTPQIKVAGYYQQPNFSSLRSLSLEEGVIMGGSVAYKTNPNTTLVWHYKRAYDKNTGRVETSQYYEVQFGF